MAEGDYVEGLTGKEIITDFLAQIEEKLTNDCNLRETDSYPGGYDGSFEYHLNLHGMDRIEVKGKISVSDPEGVRVLVNEKVFVAEEKGEVPVEERLNVVRERSHQDVPTLSLNEDGVPTIKKRQYTRRPVVAGAHQ